MEFLRVYQLMINLLRQDSENKNLGRSKIKDKSH